MLALSPTFDGKRTIPSPDCRALIMQMLNLGPQDKVLEIGTGSGTMTSEFGATGAEVHSIELEPWVDSTQVIGDCVYLHTGDGVLGLPQFAPFDAIVATCGVEQIPRAWEEQLRPLRGDGSSYRDTVSQRSRGGSDLDGRISASLQNESGTEESRKSGRLIVPIGDASSQRLTLFRKDDSGLRPIKVGAYVRFQMMRERPSPKPPKYNPTEEHA